MVIVTKLGLLYTSLITAAILVGGTIVGALFYAGSASIPGWRGFFQPGPLSLKHSFLNDKCEACHTPIRGVEATTCIACHVTAAVDLAKQPTAFHASIQDCRGCHVEHQGAVRPTRMDHRSLVRISSDARANAGGHSSVSRQMVYDIAAYLGVRVSTAAENNALNCASCHSNQDPHKQLFGRECADCHATTEWQIASFLHPSPTSRDCAQCHQAPPSHYMEHFRMVSMTVAGQPHARVNECYLCHKTNAFNEIKGAGWYKHH